MDLKALILLFPVIFMIHEFEEIIFFKQWILRNEDELARRFPRISKRMLPRLKRISTSSFVMGVAEEFLLISALSTMAILIEIYPLWYGVLIGFSVHILGHIVQWGIYRKYIPAIVTSILVLPYCIYVIIKMNGWGVLTANEQVLWGAMGCVLVVLNLIFLHKLMLIFEAWRGKC